MTEDHGFPESFAFSIAVHQDYIVARVAGEAAVSVLVVDATWVPPVLVPFFVTAATLVAAAVLTLLVLIAEPAGTVRGLVRPCLYLVARRWYLAAANLVVLGVAVTIIWSRR
ncbi:MULTISPECIES: hypothetical protein [unclassified Nonomuraea]|uniref:hypothetical protein n=1 Tax=unclassified Nonomuraea TaxID=2593643 RepID=UPI0033DA90B6